MPSAARPARNSQAPIRRLPVCRMRAIDLPRGPQVGGPGPEDRQQREWVERPAQEDVGEGRSGRRGAVRQRDGRQGEGGERDDQGGGATHRSHSRRNSMEPRAIVGRQCGHETNPAGPLRRAHRPHRLRRVRRDRRANRPAARRPPSSGGTGDIEHPTGSEADPGGRKLRRDAAGPVHGRPVCRPWSSSATGG